MKMKERDGAWESDQTFVNILTNGGFKAFFGDENNSEEVMEVINTLLPEHCQVVEIEYLPTEHQGPIVGESKEMHYDYMCRDKSGAIFIVEMQRYKEKHWFKRCVSYACRAYDRQNKRGHEYDIPPVYLISLMGVEIDHHDKEYWKNKFIAEYTFRERSTYEVLENTIFIIFAELANFKKSKEDCHTKLDRILYLLKNSGTMTKETSPRWEDFETCDRILNKFLIAGFSEDKLIKYQSEMYDERRRMGELMAAFEDGEQKGREEGRVQGREEGLELGREAASMENAKKLKELGVAIDIIAQGTGLPIETIENL